MSTQQLLDAVLKKSPQSDPEAVLEILISCNGDIDQTLKLLGVSSPSKQRQMTFSGVAKKRPGSVKPIANTAAAKVDLFSPDQVKNASIDCLLFENVLESTLANSLLCELMQDSQQWKNQHFYLFDRKASTASTSAVYSCNDDILNRQDTTYQGRTVSKVHSFTPAMHAACKSIEQLIAQIYPKVGWYSDLVVTNRYDGGDSSIGYHSDQLTHLGPRPIIAGLSLGASRVFSLKKKSQKKGATIYNIHARHNSLILMLPGCQERWKHSIPPCRAVGSHALSDSTRISVTFRMYPPEYRTENLPKCKCNKTMILRTTNKDDFKYIWMCGQPYVSNVGCNQVIDADSIDMSGGKKSSN